VTGETLTDSANQQQWRQTSTQETPTPTGELVRVHDQQAVICSEAMHKLMAMVERVAANDSAVLITGETGSGKEVVARAIHARSQRANKPWVDINCAALPEHLVESELFGYEKGAFSGADAVKPGMFELANQGTLFLDEVGELEPRIQVKLLRVLDGVPYYRLGGSRKVAFDVRVVAATNQPLEEAVKTGRFRTDLYHRLCQIQLRVPPLRERPDDIVALAEFYLQQTRPGARFAPGVRDILVAQPWPGNIRELRNVIAQAATMASGDEIGCDDLPPEVRLQVAIAGALPRPAEPGGNLDLDDMERQAILLALQKCGGHQGMAAEQLGISRRTLSRKLKQFRIESGSESALPSLTPAVALGKLSVQQHECFRASVELPVKVHAESGFFTLRTLNVSVGGMALEGITEPFRLSGELKVECTLPAGFGLIVARARMVWADAHGKAGVLFTDLPSHCRDALNQWLQEIERQEGWTVEEKS
jgi:DNA-binding NtrC family response regulator